MRRAPPRPAPALLAALAAAWLALPLTGQSAPTVIEEPDFGYRFELPIGWHVASATTAGRAHELVLVPDDLADARLTLRINPQGAGDLSPEEVRQLSIDAVDADPIYTGRELVRLRRAGRDVPGLRCDVTGQGEPLRLTQGYLRWNGDLFMTQSLAPRAGFAKASARFDDAWSHLELTEPGPERLERQRLAALAARCGSEIDWAADWDEASARARREGRPILVWVHQYGGFDLTDDTMVSAFMDEDIVGLLRHRFVALRLRRDDPAPFRDHEVYGMGPSTFGQAALVVDERGRVVSSCQAPLERFLREQAQAWPGAGRSPRGAPTDRIERARWALERGRLDLAHESLGAATASTAGSIAADDASRAAAWLLLADLRRRERDLDGALDALDAAAREDGAGRLADRIDGERAEVLVRLGRDDEALAIGERLLADPDALQDDADERRRLRYGVALLRARAGARAVAEQELLALTREDPGSRWAWIAAATLTSTAWQVDRLGDRRADPTVDPYELLRPPVFAPVPASRIADARDDARAWLLAEQRDDGSWDTPFGLGAEADAPPGELHLAAVALCGTALFEEGGEASLAAAEAALGWCLDGVERIRRDGETPLYMDYVVWSRPALVDLLLAAGRAWPDRAGQLAPHVRAALTEIEAQAKPRGGWSYYLSGTAEGSGAAPDLAMSFTTGAAVLTLLDAREAGFLVGQAVLDGALDALEACLSEDGQFAYWRETDGSAPRGQGMAGAVGRGPVCALALERGGRRDGQLVERALELFDQHHDALFAERGKVLMHTGAAGQGSHYLLFDLMHAARALASVDGSAGRRARRSIVEELLAMRTADGAHVDNPLQGRAPATAMALRAYAALLGPVKPDARSTGGR